MYLLKLAHIQRNKKFMKIANRHLLLVFLSLIASGASLDDLPRVTRDFLSRCTGTTGGGVTTPQDMDGIDLKANSPALQGTAEEIDFSSNLTSSPYGARQRGDLPSYSPPLPPAEYKGKDSFPGYLIGEVPRGSRLVPSKAHIRIAATRRKREEKYFVQSEIYPEAKKQLRTLDLLKGFGQYTPSDPSASLDEVSRQAGSFHRVAETDATQFQIDNEINVVPINPVRTNQELMKALENQIKIPAFKRTRKDKTSVRSSLCSTFNTYQDFDFPSRSVRGSTSEKLGLIPLMNGQEPASHQKDTLIRETDRNRQIHSPLESTGNLKASPTTTDELAPYQVEIGVETLKNPSKINALTSQAASTRDDRFLRLEFTLQVPYNEP
ncbi:hypothetical protein PGT21_002909 [Puccinia graminis f. sp. tritici]|uniref:Uncharacterized protein n=1 Tax=Puccinia graminis f. sp. tritici TaxID=56615 RepID=A0A5B0NM24_PUCGR|nr:hypothetical protein PGT21_002909 [Puccinia graminis f. sp. tritici]